MCFVRTKEISWSVRNMDQDEEEIINFQKPCENLCLKITFEYCSLALPIKHGPYSQHCEHAVCNYDGNFLHSSLWHISISLTIFCSPDFQHLNGLKWYEFVSNNSFKNWPKIPKQRERYMILKPIGRTGQIFVLCTYVKT